MSKNIASPATVAHRRRAWVKPELSRLAAGHAELAVGTQSDGPNLS